MAGNADDGRGVNLLQTGHEMETRPIEATHVKEGSVMLISHVTNIWCVKHKIWRLFFAAKFLFIKKIM